MLPEKPPWLPVEGGFSMLHVLVLAFNALLSSFPLRLHH